MSEITFTLAIVASMLAGIAVVYVFMKGRTASIVSAAVAQAQAVLQGETGQLRERARALEEARAAAQDAHDALKKQAESWRDALDTARDDTAKLTERASRVQTLEAELDSLREQLRQSQSESRLIAEDRAQKATALDNVKERLQSLQEHVASLEQRSEQTTTALNDSNERKAALEEQVAAIPALRAELDAFKQQAADLSRELAQARESLNSQIAKLSAELTAEKDGHVSTRSDLATERQQRERADAEVLRLTQQLTELTTRSEAEQHAAQRQLEQLREAKEVMTDQFKTLAAEILEDKAKRFAEQNQATLGQMLDPLRTQLSEFKGKVEEVYVQEGKDRSALAEQVRHLLSLNQALSEDAKNLTLALKGSAKTQGNWGELILERVLESTGLRKGIEYHVQQSQVRDDGSRAQPDVVIDLPEDRKLVVDAKVSLVAYEEFVSAQADEERTLALRRHLDSVRSHIKGLSGKQYEQLYGLKSLDFVLMFVPIEPAFMMAVTNDDKLFMDAWERNVLLVSPSTLLFVVRTVAHLWRQEQQSRNAQDIAKRGAEMYDRLTAFVEDLEAVGKRLTQAQDAFAEARKKLVQNKGNVIRQAEMLRDLGVKPTKTLPAPLVEDAMAADDAVEIALATQAPRISHDDEPTATTNTN